MARFRRCMLVGLMCATVIGAAPSVVRAQYDTATVVLPAGDPHAGRQAFVDLKCTVCHKVEGESRFPAPLSESQGPDLSRALALRTASDLAAAIIVPSHSMSVKTSEPIKQRLQQLLLSPMPDYTRAMTVRQLADLLAYLRSLGPAK
jgi:mono/diheme cytochrome c family protein